MLLTISLLAALVGLVGLPATPPPAPTAAPTPVATPVTAPVAVAERRVTRGETVTRLSLFSNRVAVLSVHEPGTPDFVRRRTLTQEEYVGYLASLAHDAPLVLQEESGPPPLGSGDQATLTLRVGVGRPRTVHYSPTAVSHLALSRVNAALDDLETLLRETSASRAELEGWTPAAGDRVELWGGETARVVEVRDDGVVILEHDQTPLIEALTPDQLPQRIRRLLPREP